MRGRRNRGNVFIANLPQDFHEDQLAEAFDPFGIVLSAEIARDPTTGALLRHGWVDIASERAASAAIAGLNGTELAGSRIEVRPSERRTSNKAAKPAPKTAKRAVPRPAQAPREADAETPAVPPSPRPQPHFVVEKRPLPRRVVIPPR